MNIKSASRPSYKNSQRLQRFIFGADGSITMWRSLKWWTPVSCKTFLLKIFCRLNPQVATRALYIPIWSNEISVMVAIATPMMIGTRDKYTCTITKENKRSIRLKIGPADMRLRKEFVPGEFAFHRRLSGRAPLWTGALRLWLEWIKRQGGISMLHYLHRWKRRICTSVCKWDRHLPYWYVGEHWR